jgi:hypothetical protein
VRALCSGRDTLWLTSCAVLCAPAARCVFVLLPQSGVPDIAVSKDVSPVSGVIGTPFTYTVTL